MAMLSVEQQELVAQNLNIVDIVIHKHITVRPDIPGMEYDDLYQIGSLALCKAATKFDGRYLFSTFATAVVRNDLMEYCRNSCRKQVTESLNADATESGSLAMLDVLRDPNPHAAPVLRKALSAVKKNYSGCPLKGIEAMELKLKGYTGAEIAELYGVKNNMVTAWISRAAKRLRKDERFLAEFL